MVSNTTTYSLLTPPGEGGISVILLRGPQGHKILASVFRTLRGTRREVFEPDHIYVGTLIGEDSTPVDEVLVRVFGDGVEINCHGGMMPVRKVIQTLSRFGVKEEPVVSAIKSAVEDEAIAELEMARTRSVARMLLDQLNGALSRELVGIVEMLSMGCRNAVEQSLARVEQLLGNSEIGRAFVRPRRVVIVGTPNVGKSMLFNALVGRDRAITDATPGTTRDAIAEHIAIEGVPFVVVDTAGIRPPESEAERLALEIQKEEQHAADLSLHVLDLSRPLTEKEKETLNQLVKEDVCGMNRSRGAPSAGSRIFWGPRARTCPHCGRASAYHESTSDRQIPALNDVAFPLQPTIGRHDPDVSSSSILVFNKIDLPRALDVESIMMGSRMPPFVEISALTRQGLDRLEETILKLTGPRWIAGMAVPFTERQVCHLQRAYELLTELLSSPEEAAIKKTEVVKDELRSVISCGTRYASPVAAACHR